MNETPGLHARHPQPPPRRKGNGLAITALVFAALFFIPLMPTIGLILGVIALLSGRSKTISIVAVSIGGFLTIMTILYVAIAIPAFMTYIKHAKSIEAKVQLSKLGEAVAATNAHTFAALPDSDWTPAGSACSYPNQKFPVDAAVWMREPWKSLGFHVGFPSHYQLRVTRNWQGFLVEARGDLNCDGKLSHFSRQVTSEGLQPSDNTN